MKRLLGAKAILALGTVVIAGIILVVTQKKNTSEREHGGLHVVVLAPLTGPGASLGMYVKNGVELAQVDIGQSKTMPLTVEFVDSKNLPKEGVSGLQSALLKRKPQAVICAMSSVSKAVVPIVEQAGVLMIATTTALTDLPKGTKTVVRMYPTSEDYIGPVVKYMLSRHDRVGVLYVHDDFGESNRQVLSEMCQKAGKQVVAAETYELGAMEMRETIGRVLVKKPDCVFVTGYGPAFISAFKQLREINQEIPIFSELGFGNPAVLDALGPVADGIVFNGTSLESSTPEDQHASQFQTHYREKFKAEPYQVAGYAYDSIMQIAALSEHKGRIDKTSWVSHSPVKGVMGQIAFNQDGECGTQLHVMKREGSKSLRVK
jgi:branched-chain amino acid transport system substrate-binding protein